LGLVSGSDVYLRGEPMSRRAAITIMRPRGDVERFWRDAEYRPDFIDGTDATVRFLEAPGDHGTEIHVELTKSAPGGKFGDAVTKLLSTEPLAKVKNDLRRFKQRVETGVIARSESVPEGELAERKLKQRPAQPLGQSEREKVGV
jgi:uncharacterized membrane protein